MSTLRSWVGRGRRRLGRDLQRAGRRVAGPKPGASSSGSATTTGPGPASSGGPSSSGARTSASVPEGIDLDLYTRDPDPAVAEAILDGAFGHGYLVRVGPDVTLPGFLGDWEVSRLGPLTLHRAPRTVVTTASPATSGADVSILLLGHPVDIERGSVDAQQIADRLLTTLAHAGPDAMVREAAYLAGRWTLLAVAGGELTVVPDTMASQPVLYRADGAGLTLASSEILVAIAHDLAPSAAEAAAVARGQQLRSGVVYSPGVLTAIDGVLPLIPNHLLRADLSRPGRVRHERFWPFEPRVEEPDLEQVHAAFQARMSAHIGLLQRLGPRWWSLTGGLDSRVSLAHLDLAEAPGARAFTYLNPRDIARSADVADDLFLPSLLAERLGMRHRVIRWRQPDAGSAFDRLHRATYPLRRASHGAAHAMWADVPRDAVEVQSNGAEIGTVHTRPRTDAPLSPDKLVTLWLGRIGRSEPSFPAIFADYLAHAEFTDERLLGYDHHDVFYWEHRMGRWGHRKFLDGDFGHRLMLPFNDRMLLETMHRSPEEQRTSKALYARVLRDRRDLDVESYRR